MTAKEGETIYNLSRRFGVPADVIMKVNGLSEAATVCKAGQKLVIPTYVYNRKAPVSAPDNNPKVAGAKSSTATGTPGASAGTARSPADKVAVLPKSPKLKEGETQPPTEAAAAKPATRRRAKGDKVSRQGRHLHGRVRRHAVQDRQEERRQRRRAEEGERHARTACSRSARR